jgi:hypothetical protein
MNRTTLKGKLSTTIVLFATLALITWSQRAWAGNHVCLPVYVNQTATLTSSTTSTGTIPSGGILTGTTADLFTSALTATPNPDTFSFTDTFTFTTKLGTLTTSDVSIFNTTALVYSSIQQISNGTGIFTDATGTLYSSGSSTNGVNFTDVFIGQVCLVLQ